MCLGCELVYLVDRSVSRYICYMGRITFLSELGWNGSSKRSGLRLLNSLKDLFRTVINLSLESDCKCHYFRSIYSVSQACPGKPDTILEV